MGTFAEVFRAAAGASGVLSFARFMELALYHPGMGYYAARRRRVGRETGTDFYTASSVPLFGELMVAAACQLIGPERAPDHCWVEIGAEPGGGLLSGVPHPFADVRTLRWDDPLLLSGKCIVVSNELFDARPFRRFVRQAGRWREVGVRAGPRGWEETLLESDLPDFLPADAAEGYRLDAPTGAAALAEAIAAQRWSGLFLAADYGKSWEELAHGTPIGTARAYRNHRQSNDLLTDPGEQDLTCHICWDWIEAALARHRFEAIRLEAQEAFLVRHAGARIEQLATASPSSADPRKRALMHLLHPALMGRKFQVLQALRPDDNPLASAAR